MKGADIFPSKYIKADDLKGRAHLVTISHCTMEEVGNPPTSKLITYFQGAEKGLVTNKTNFGVIAYLYGDETDNWTGGKIVLAAELVTFQGKPTMAIRVKAPTGAAPHRAPLQNTENPADRITSGPIVTNTSAAALQRAAAAAEKQKFPGDKQQHDSELTREFQSGAFDDDIPF